MPLRLVTACLLFALAGAASAQTFVFHLRGDQEVPPEPSVASGGCHGQLNQGAGTFALTCVHNVTNATVMHVHKGAPGANGPIVFDLGDPASPVTATWSGMTATDIADVLAGNLYINVHSAGRPSGEIRGQILQRTVDAVSFTADGPQFVPPSSTSASASCTADLNSAATLLQVQCTHNVPSASEAIVGEAPVGQNGPTIFTFSSAASPLNADVPMTPRLVADYAATFLYLAVLSAPGSEDTATAQIRGQIGTPPAGAGTGTIRIVKETSPDGGTSFGFTETITSATTFTLNDGGVRTFNGVAAGTYTVTENDPASSPGNHSLAGLSCDDANSAVDPFTRTATIALDPGEVVTCTFRNVLASATDSLFVFHLSADQEAPPTSSSSRGGCMGRFDTASSALTLICTHNVPNATVMHVHRGAAGVNGPIVFDLGDPRSPMVTTWSAMAPSAVADLFAGNFYVNIHTAGRPAGEIRGQIVERSVDTVSFSANSGQVVPPGTSAAAGACSADLDASATALFVQCTHDLASPDTAHIHEAPYGANGPAAYAFPSAASPFSSNVPMSPRLVADFAGGLLYLDIHASAGGDEAPDQIRGQIGGIPAPATTGTIRIVKATSPAGGTGFTFTDNVPGSPGTFVLGDGGMQTFSNVTAGTYTIAENAIAGWSLTDVACDDDDSTGNPFTRTATISLQGGELVTCTFRNLQTFAAPSSLFVFHLSGDQEVPPNPSPARGGCMGQFDAASSSLSIVCTHNVADATVLHVHRAARGANGPIVFDLGEPSSPVEATWSAMSPADVTDLMAGNLYVNIHTGGRPAGEIRGQILPRTVDSFNFAMDGAHEVPPTASTASARCFADLADNATSLYVECDHGVSGANAIHLHDAPAGMEGPVVFDFPNADPFSADVPMTPRLVADFAAGFLYADIHSAAFPNGEIRGQLIAGADVPGETIPTMAWWMAMSFAAALVGLGAWRLR